MALRPPRPRDAAATKQMILDEARAQFARAGYRGATVKAIADGAGVSPNLVTRYFGGKEGLFLAASAPQIATDGVYTGDVTHLGDRLAESIVRRWSAPPGEDPLLLLQRAAGERPDAAEALSLFLDEHSKAPLERYLVDRGMSADEAGARAAAVDVFVLGVSTRHRVLRSDLDRSDHFQAWLATAIQALIDDPRAATT